MRESRVLVPKTGPERRAGYQTNIPPTPASLEVVSESSESVAQMALQGLTCEKKTESKAADLYSE